MALSCWHAIIPFHYHNTSSSSHQTSHIVSGTHSFYNRGTKMTSERNNYTTKVTSNIVLWGNESRPWKTSSRGQEQTAGDTTREVMTNRPERTDREQKQPLRSVQEMQRWEESSSPDGAYPWGESLSSQPLTMGATRSDSEVKLA